MIRNLFLITLISSILIGCDEVEFKPVGSDLQAQDICSKHDGVKSFQVHEYRYNEYRLEIVCGNDSRWAQDYDISYAKKAIDNQPLLPSSLPLSTTPNQ